MTPLPRRPQQTARRPAERRRARTVAEDPIRGCRFGVQYEPIVEVRTGTACAYEALARFHRRDGSLVDTSRVFAALHCDPSRLADIELRMKELQVRHAPRGTLFVNVDPDAFALCRDRALPLVGVLASRSEHVVVEVVENIGTSDAAHIRTMIRELELAGLGAALDDIGAPNALVSFDSFLSVQYLKLDRSTLRACGDLRRRTLVEGLVGLAQRLGVRTVLEGIETTEDLAMAEALGVDLVQGYLFRDRFVIVAATPSRAARARRAA